MAKFMRRPCMDWIQAASMVPDTQVKACKSQSNTAVIGRFLHPVNVRTVHLGWFPAVSMVSRSLDRLDAPLKAPSSTVWP